MGGCSQRTWIGATAYHLYTLWHINNENQITVLYPNFQKSENRDVSTFVGKTKVIADRWNIDIVWTLQEGKEKLDSTVYPLIHFISHSVLYIDRLTITSRNYITVHNGKKFTASLKLLIGMKAKLQAIRDAIKNERTIDPILESFFDDAMVQDFVSIFNRLNSQTDKHHAANVTVRLVTRFMEIINSIQARKNVVDKGALTINSAKIVTAINDLLLILDHPDFVLTIPCGTSHQIRIVLKLYREAFLKYPQVPFEAFIFSSEYEVVITYKHQNKRPNDRLHHLLERIMDGKHYPNFTYWCGSSRNRMDIQRLNIPSGILSLAMFLPKKLMKSKYSKRKNRREIK